MLELDLLGYKAVREQITQSWIPVLQLDRIAKATIFDKHSDFVDKLAKKVKVTNKVYPDSEFSLKDMKRILGNALRVIKMTQLYVIGGWFYAPQLFLTFIISAKVATQDTAIMESMMRDDELMSSI